jgi:CelD/BcsL family acetyltransferase involved in cellulose biosynthesis
MRLAAQMPDGFDAWYAGRRGVWGKYFKDKERAGRSLERDHGVAEYRLHDESPEVLDWIIARKRAQYRLTGQYDVFDCGWTGRLLRALLQTRTATTGARIATLRVGGRLAAAEYSLREGAHNHFWFPVYEPELARYSCGALLSLQTMRLAANDGVTWADFGLDAEGYKKYYAEPVGSVLEGVARAHGGAVAASSGAETAMHWRARAERRLAVIVACEGRWSRAAAAVGQAAASAAIRRLRPATA